MENEKSKKIPAAQRVQLKRAVQRVTPSNDEIVLIGLLRRWPEIGQKLLTALSTGKFFITISFQQKLKADNSHDLHHYWNRTGYPANDVLASIDHLANDYISKEQPNAQLRGKAGGFY